MKKVLLFGGTGNLGKKIAEELLDRNYDLTMVVRTEKQADSLKGQFPKFKVMEVTQKVALQDCCDGFDIVVSTLGKSVSPQDNSKPTYMDIDYGVNAAILDEAVKSGVKKFVYISVFHAERYLHLNYFKAHHDFAEKLKQSGIDYSIIKPLAIFCAFGDVIEMAKKGRLVNLGKGDKKTNPIYEGDLAKIVVDSIVKENCEIEAGGKEIFTRNELNQIVQKISNPNKKVRNVPSLVIKLMLPLIKLTNKNRYDKFAFFTEVHHHDTIAPQLGETRFEDYIRSKVV